MLGGGGGENRTGQCFTLTTCRSYDHGPPLPVALPMRAGALRYSHGPDPPAEAATVTDASDYDVKRPLRDVIGTLLKLVLLPGQRDLIPRPTDMVSACKGVVEHHGKLWGELTEGENNIVAARVGVIAHEIIRTGRSAETGETLH